MRIDSYEDKFFIECWFPVMINGRSYRCRMARNTPRSATFHVQTNPEENLGLLYLYILEPLYPGDESSLEAACREAFAERLPGILDAYFRFMSRKLTPDRFLDILSHNPDFYDAFRFSLQDDVTYITGRYPRIQKYWQAFARLDTLFPSTGKNGFFAAAFQKREAMDFPIRTLGAALLGDDWSELTPRAGVKSLHDRPKVFLPATKRHKRVTVRFRASATGSLAILCEGAVLTKTSLATGSVTFIVVPAAEKRVIELHIQAIGNEPPVLELVGINLDPLLEPTKK